jgi:hypothetical protein
VENAQRDSIGHCLGALNQQTPSLNVATLSPIHDAVELLHPSPTVVNEKTSNHSKCDISASRRCHELKPAFSLRLRRPLRRDWREGMVSVASVGSQSSTAMRRFKSPDGVLVYGAFQFAGC